MGNSVNETGRQGNNCPETAPSGRGQFIFDADLRAKYGDAAELLIDALDRLPATQKVTRPLEGRPRLAVEEWLKANGRG